MITYAPLWKTISEKGIKKTELAKTYGVISTSTLAKLGRNSPLNTETIDKLCKFLKCPITDVVEFVDDSTKD